MAPLHATSSLPSVPAAVCWISCLSVCQFVFAVLSLLICLCSAQKGENLFLTCLHVADLHVLLHQCVFFNPRRTDLNQRREEAGRWKWVAKKRKGRERNAFSDHQGTLGLAVWIVETPQSTDILNVGRVVSVGAFPPVPPGLVI